MSGRYGRGLANAAIACVLLVVGSSWAVASHPSSSPDDGFHLASTWCAWGQDAAGCQAGTPSGGGRWVRVPPLADVISQCTNRKPDLSAACIAQDTGSATQFPTYANAGAYPPGYYAVARLFVGPETVRSILLQRIAAFCVSAALIVAAGLLLPARDRWVAWLYLAAISVPLGLFIFASNNPSGTSIAGCVAVAAGAYAIGRQRDRRHAAAATGLALLGTLVAAQSRADGWQFATLSLGLGAVASLPSLRAVLQPSRLVPWALVMGALTVALLGSGRPPGLGYSPSSGAERSSSTQEFANLLEIPGINSGDMATSSSWVGLSPSVFTNLLEIPRFYIGEFATNLGSFDTPMPAVTWGSMALVLGGLVLWGVADMTRYRGLALGLAAIGLVLVPMYMLLSLGAPVGYWVQPRYLLPLLLTTGLLLAVRPERRATPIQLSQVIVLGGLAVLAHTWALHRRIRRSVTGIDEDGLDLGQGAEWWWEVAVGPNIVWAVGSLAFLSLVAGLIWRIWEAERGPSQRVRGVALRRGGHGHVAS